MSNQRVRGRKKVIIKSHQSMPDLYIFTLQRAFKREKREKSGKNFHPWNNATGFALPYITQNPHKNVIHGDLVERAKSFFTLFRHNNNFLLCVSCFWSITRERESAKQKENTWKLLLQTRDFLNYDYDYFEMNVDGAGGKNGKSFALHNSLSKRRSSEGSML